MNPQDVKILVGWRMDEVAESLDDARLLLSRGQGARSIVNRAYYAAFYGVLALLQTVGEIPRKHKGAISSFERLFVRTGHLPRECTKQIHELFEIRLEDDYERVEPVPMEQAVHSLEVAEQFVKEVRGYLTREGFLAEPKD